MIFFHDVTYKNLYKYNDIFSILYATHGLVIRVQIFNLFIIVKQLNTEFNIQLKLINTNNQLYIKFYYIEFISNELTVGNFAHRHHQAIKKVLFRKCSHTKSVIILYAEPLVLYM